MYVFLVATLSVLLWLPSHILFPAPCSPFVMLFSADNNSTLGLVGVIILCSLLLFVCISLLVIAWDTCRSSPPNRHSQYLEFEGTELVEFRLAENNLLSAKKTFICYGLGIFCLYVFSRFLVSNSGMSVAKFHNDLSISILRTSSLRRINYNPCVCNSPVISVPLHANYLRAM